MPVNSGMCEFLRETAAAANAELKSRQGPSLRVNIKPDASLVTEADVASERVILDRIRRRFPQDKILSEEAGLSARGRPAGSYIWIVDPLDGTTNFANGFPFYSISIGRGRFRADGSIEMVTGAILDCSRERFYYAGLGEGAYVDGRPISVAAKRDFKQTFLVTGFYYFKGQALEVEIQRFARVADRCHSIRRDGSAALDLAFVSEGIYDGFWETGLKPWDVAAGSLLVTEAKGQVGNYQDFGTKPFNIEAETLVAGSPSAAETIAGLL